MKPIDLSHAKPDPQWEQKKELGWIVLARRAIQLLQERGIEVRFTEKNLASVLEDANKSLTWQEVPKHGRRDD